MSKKTTVGENKRIDIRLDSLKIDYPRRYGFDTALFDLNDYLELYKYLKGFYKDIVDGYNKDTYKTNNDIYKKYKKEIESKFKQYTGIPIDLTYRNNKEDYISVYVPVLKNEGISNLANVIHSKTLQEAANILKEEIKNIKADIIVDVNTWKVTVKDNKYRVRVSVDFIGILDRGRALIEELAEELIYHVVASFKYFLVYDQNARLLYLYTKTPKFDKFEDYKRYILSHLEDYFISPITINEAKDVLKEESNPILWYSEYQKLFGKDVDYLYSQLTGDLQHHIFKDELDRFRYKAKSKVDVKGVIIAGSLLAITKSASVLVVSHITSFMVSMLAFNITSMVLFVILAVSLTTIIILFSKLESMFFSDIIYSIHNKEIDASEVRNHNKKSIVEKPTMLQNYKQMRSKLIQQLKRANIPASEAKSILRDINQLDHMFTWFSNFELGNMISNKLLTISSYFSYNKKRELFTDLTNSLKDNELFFKSAMFSTLT